MALHEIPTLAFTPDSNIRLLSGVPLSKDYQHTRLFESESQQANYFSGKIKRGSTGASYVKKDSIIRVDDNAENLFNVNYLMFQNANYSNKWFYGFVTNIEYKSPNTTWIHYEIDVLQTWLFDFQLKASFIDREHTVLMKDGLPVINTIDEGLNYGNAYDTTKQLQIEQSASMVFAIITTKAKLEAESGTESAYRGTMYGMPSTLNYYIIPVPLTNLTDNGRFPYMYHENSMVTELQDFYGKIADKPKMQDQIVSIAFTSFIPFDFSYTINRDDDRIYIKSTDLEVVSFNGIGVLKPKTYVGSKALLRTVTENKYRYLPAYAETKLLMYPYSFIEITNQKGEKIEVHLEDIVGNTPKELKVTILSSISNMPKTALLVDNLNELNSSGIYEMEKALITNDVQDVPIISDYTATYLQGNKNSHNQSLINAGVNFGTSMVGAGMLGNPYMAISSTSSLLTTVSTLSAKMKDIDNHPPSMKNLGKNANFDISNGNNGLFINYKTIKPEYRTKLEGFFKLFGYKVNEVKVPNLKTRQSWNYIKTAGVTIQGSIIQTDLDKIKKIFDNGVTFWHTNDVGNYNLSNNPR